MQHKQRASLGLSCVGRLAHQTVVVSHVLQRVQQVRKPPVCFCRLIPGYMWQYQPICKLTGDDMVVSAAGLIDGFVWHMALLHYHSTANGSAASVRAVVGCCLRYSHASRPLCVELFVSTFEAHDSQLCNDPCRSWQSMVCDLETYSQQLIQRSARR